MNNFRAIKLKDKCDWSVTIIVPEKDFNKTMNAAKQQKGYTVEEVKVTDEMLQNAILYDADAKMLHESKKYINHINNKQ